jgi:hypothetical protein
MGIEISKEEEIKMPVEYVLSVEYSGFPDEADRQIEKVVGKTCDGSGYGFGGRDMSFYFKTVKGANGAKERLLLAKKNKVKLPKGLKLSISKFDY